MSRSSRSHNPLSTIHWRDLDVAQMHIWPTPARRIALAVLAVLLTLLLGWWWVSPVWLKSQQVAAQTAMLQQQFIQAATQTHISADESAATPPMLLVAPNDTAQWLGGFAQSAQTSGLRAVNIRPIYATQTATAAAAPPNAAKDAPKEPNNAAAPSDPSVGRILFAAEASDAALFPWLASVSARDEIISVQEIQVQGIGDGRVRFQAQIDFAQGVQP